jgi:hypothetical protein
MSLVETHWPSPLALVQTTTIMRYQALSPQKWYVFLSDEKFHQLTDLAQDSHEPVQRLVMYAPLGGVSV